MRGDPTMPVVCDGCDFEDHFDMTPLAQGSFDHRNLDAKLRDAGWRVDEEEGLDLCPDCAAEIVELAP